MRMSKLALVPVLLALPLVAAAQWRPPADSQRCPSTWGAGDERGSGNLMKPDTVVKAAKMIRTGEAIEIAWPLG